MDGDGWGPGAEGTRLGTFECAGVLGFIMSLKIYPVVLELVRRLAPVIRVLRARSSALAEQMERALISVPLNVAEVAPGKSLGGGSMN
jgi:hypothetical protein